MKAIDDIYDISMFDVQDTQVERIFGNILYREEEQIPDTFIEKLLDQYLEMGVYTHMGMSFDVYCKQNKASLDLITSSLTKYKERLNTVNEKLNDVDITKLLKG